MQTNTEHTEYSKENEFTTAVNSSWADMAEENTNAAETSNVATATDDTVEPVVGNKYFARVKWFNGTKGYGFVTVLDTNTDLFIHHSEIKTTSSCWKTLYTGEYVELVVGTDNEGKVCGKSLTGIQGGQLMCENTRTSR